jgi:hypothetical protein
MREATMKEFWESALLGPLEALGKQVLGLLPNVLAMTIIFLFGLLAAWILGQAVGRFLRAIGLDHLCHRAGVTAALARGGVKTDPSLLVGRGIYWVVFLFATMAALGALNLQPINQFARSLLAYLPHLFVAVVILTAGYILSNFVSQTVLIAAVNAGLPPARLVAGAARWGILLVSMAMALEQLGIAQTIVVVGFGLTFGGVVLAAAIAFGFGAKDLAKEYLERRLSPRSRENTADDLKHL